MKAIIVRIVLGGAALLALEACAPTNPLVHGFSLGIPDFARTRTHWYSSTVSHVEGGNLWGVSGRACQEAISMAKKADHGNPAIKKIDVTGVMKDDQLISVTCRVEI